MIEAKELARHADVRMTMKYTHIGLEDQAEALAACLHPNICTYADWLRIGCVSGGVGVRRCQRMTATTTRTVGPETTKPLAGRGFVVVLSQTVSSSQLT